MKQQVAPLQANEVANIRRKSAGFDVRQHNFREEFRKMKAFQYACDNPYDLIDEVLAVSRALCKIYGRKWKLCA
jgi:dynein heavy chain